MSEIDHQLDKILGRHSVHFNYSKKETRKKLLTLIEASNKEAAVGALEDLSMDVVEPCEPECDAVRHAKHEGSWNAHLIIEDRINTLKEEE